MILFAYGHQSLQVIHYVILWIVLSRMSIQPALRTQGQTDGMTKSSAWGTCAPLRGRLWRQGHGLSGFPSGISPAKSASRQRLSVTAGAFLGTATDDPITSGLPVTWQQF